jgi:uncharacterized protein YkwD
MVPARFRIAWLLLLAASPSAAAADDGDWAARVLQAVNDARQQHGVPALLPAPELQRIAQRHSDEMAARRRLSHDGFQARFDSTDSLLCVENVAGGTTSPSTLVAAWTRAPRHRSNLFEPRVRRVGIADNRGYVTLFACE